MFSSYAFFRHDLTRLLQKGRGHINYKRPSVHSGNISAHVWQGPWMKSWLCIVSYICCCIFPGCMHICVEADVIPISLLYSMN
jgi:hypothetical protein